MPEAGWHLPSPCHCHGILSPSGTTKDFSLLVLPWGFSHCGTAVGFLSLRYHCGTSSPGAAMGFFPSQYHSPASTTTGPFPPWLPLPQCQRCSDDASWSEDRGDTKCLCHLPAAGQWGAEALTVVFCLGWLSLEELNGFPASGDIQGGARGRSSPLGMGWAQARDIPGSPVPQNNSQS